MVNVEQRDRIRRQLMLKGMNADETAKMAYFEEYKKAEKRINRKRIIKNSVILSLAVFYSVINYEYGYGNDDVDADYATANTLSAYTSSTLSDDPLSNEELMVDSCASIYPGGDDDYLLEFYTSSSNVYQKIYKCAYGCVDGVCCEDSDCSNNLNTKCNDGEDNDGDGEIDYSGVVSFSDGTYISCKDDVGASVYSKYVEDFRLSYENDEMHYLEGNLGYTCYDEFFEKMDAWLITYSDYTVSTACKSFCEIFYEVYYDTCNEEFSSEFPVSCTYYEEDSVCEDINTNAERSISSVRAAELEQNIFMRILNFVIESNPVIDLFRKK